MAIRAILAAVLASCALTAHAAKITTTWAGAAGDAPREIAVQAHRVEGAAESLDFNVAVPGTTDLALSEGLWEVRVAGEGAWAAPAYLRNVDAADLRVWPTMVLQGTTNDIKALRAQFTPAGEDGAKGEVPCVVKEKTWTCRLPIGRYDVRFSSPEMAPEFRLAISAESRKADLALHFVAGASLYGWADAAGAEVSLQGNAVQQTTPANTKGFFQFKGLAPGDYLVSARTKGLVAPAQKVRILSGVAAELGEPLHLQAPRELTVLVLPPVDPDGQRWRIRLFPAKSGALVTEERVPEVGQWTRSGLVPGDYDLSLADAQGGQWHSETIPLGSENRIVAVTASGTSISGRVTFGGRPLSNARLSFGGEGGRVLQADEDGRFTGQIPVGDRAERMIFVEADTPSVSRTVHTNIEANHEGKAHLLLELPATTFMGRVVNEDGSPAEAVLKVTGVTDADVFEQAATETDGTFQITGLDAGTYQVVAETSELRSDLLKIDLTAKEPREVEIVLRHQELLRGKMTIGETPVIAARILAIPRDAKWSTFLPQTTTNERGMFQLRLPPGTTIFDGMATHPAFDTVIARAGVRPGKVVWVQATQIGGTVLVNSKEPHEVLLLHKGAEFPITTVAALSGGTVGAEQVAMTRLEPGEYTVCAFDKTNCASGYLPPHGSLTLTPK